MQSNIQNVGSIFFLFFVFFLDLKEEGSKASLTLPPLSLSLSSPQNFGGFSVFYAMSPMKNLHVMPFFGMWVSL